MNDALVKMTLTYIQFAKDHGLLDDLIETEMRTQFPMLTRVGKMILDGDNAVLTRPLGFTTDGAAFIFGNLARGDNVPVGTPIGSNPAFGPLDSSGTWAGVGAFFAFNVLPTIIFFSSLMSVL